MIFIGHGKYHSFPLLNISKYLIPYNRFRLKYVHSIHFKESHQDDQQKRRLHLVIKKSNQVFLQFPYLKVNDQGDITDLLTSLRAMCVLSDPISNMLPEAVRPKVTVWLENLEKMHLTKKPVCKCFVLPF